MATGEAMKPARYLFDEVFSLDADGARASAAATTAAARAAAREEGRAAGIAEGRRAAEQAVSGRIADGLERLAAGLSALDARAEADRREIEANAIELALAAAGRLAPALIDREPAAELTALLRGCLASIRDLPHVAIRVSGDLVEPMRDSFEAVAAESGFTGRLVVLGEPAIAPGDGRIDWADGGIVRDTAATLAAIETAVAGYVATRSGACQTPRDNSDG